MNFNDIISIKPCRTRILTWVSEVEVVLDVTRDVFLVFVLGPVCIWFFIVTHKQSEQDDHGDLPHEADPRQADPDVRVFGPAPEASAAVDEVPHGEVKRWSVVWSSLVFSELGAAVFIAGNLEVCQCSPVAGVPFGNEGGRDTHLTRLINIWVFFFKEVILVIITLFTQVFYTI